MKRELGGRRLRVDIRPSPGYEDTTETSIQIVTSKQKKVTVNGDITAYGNLYVADSKSGDSQNSDVVYFKGTVAADGYRLAYPCDNRVRWQGPVVAREFYVRSGYPGMGTHYLYSSSNRFEAITCLYNNISAVGTNVMGGAAWTFPSGSGRENVRGALCPAGRDQTLASLNGIPSDGGFSIDYANDTASVLTLTGGVASATVRAALGVPGNKKYGGVSLVVDAGNDDFTQIFTNSVGTTRGTVTVRNGTLRFAGASSLTNVPSFAVTGGRLELESTKADAFVNVTNVTVGANATLKVGAAAVTPFADGGRVVLTLDKDAVLDLPAGAELVVQRAYRNGSPVMKGDYSGVADEGVTARDWIVGAGRLRILAGGTGMLLYVQ